MTVVRKVQSEGALGRSTVMCRWTRTRRQEGGRRIRLLARGARPAQWLKNLLVFMAPAAAGVLGEWHTTLRVIAAFSIFCVVASGTYLVNDVVDAESDRYHPVKGLRPVASGALRPRRPRCRVCTAIVAVATAMSVGPWGFAVVVASYAG